MVASEKSKVDGAPWGSRNQEEKFQLEPATIWVIAVAGFVLSRTAVSTLFVPFTTGSLEIPVEPAPTQR